MTFLNGDKKGHVWVKLGASAALVFTLTACGTTGQMKTSASNPAPISFKGGKVDTAKQAAALSRRSDMPYISSPEMSAPRSMAYAPQAVQPGSSAQAAPQYAPHVTTPSLKQSQSFDQTSVDPDLYSHQRLGRPYKINGESYTPKHDPKYNKTGIASWYGPSFHGKLTANGETYDQNGLTAAHKTLPLNSMVFVTNLDNGKKMMVRLNDRGPFVDGRIIDLSQGAAKALGIKGLGNVRVQYAGPAEPVKSQQAEVITPAPKAPFIAAPTPAVPATPLPPVAQAPSYKPLSVVPFDLKENVALPQSAPVIPYKALPSNPAPMVIAPQAPGSTRQAPLMPQDTAPSRGRQDFTPPSDGGVMTLTIKGPIHLASSDGTAVARFIPAVYEGADAPAVSMDMSVYYVQAATFSTMARANSVKTSLSAAGGVSVHDIKRDGKTLHRVLVGPYRTAYEAKRALSLVATLGYSDARTVEVY